ncbi:MAG: hypothetical protein ACR2PK_17220, partial [Acidimicrobiales bacterium]
GLAAAGVLLVVIVVVAASQSGGDGDEDVATSPSATTETTPVATSPPTVTPAATIDAEPTPTPSSETTPTPIPTPTPPQGPTGPPGGTIWPVEAYQPFGGWPSAPEDAAQQFVNNLGGWLLPVGDVTFLDPVDMRARVSLQATGEDGEPFGEAVSVEVAGGFDADGVPNWGVVSATNDMIQIDRTTWAGTNLRPEGRGWAFEGVIDGLLVDPAGNTAGSGFVMGGGVELLPLTGSIPATQSLPGPGFALFYDIGGLGLTPNSLTVVAIELPMVDESQDCSATGLEAPEPDPSLPEPVEATRVAIARAALNCDYDGLTALTNDEFVYSFGEPPGGDAGAFWSSAEAAGDEPLRFMVELVKLPVTVDASGSPEFYVWPEAFTIAWEDLTDEQQDDVRILYDDEAMDLFEQFGSYIGYRLAIDENGDWVFFIAGD